MPGLTNSPRSLDDVALGLAPLEGRVAVVSGAGDELGGATAMLLARLGASVGVIDVDAARANAVASEAAAAGAESVALVADVSEEDDVEWAAAELEQRFGRCDALVNNTVAAVVTPLEDLDPAEWDRAMAVSLRGAFLCMRAFGGMMLAGEGGTVVNVASAAATGPAPLAAVASTGGAGRLMLSRLGAVEWGSRGVRVNAIRVGQVADPVEVAAVIAFLSGEGSSYITGESFEVDKEVRSG
ncbi:MAG TPA: SDR family oxidoreductase [Solirubrobacterales bacterium]|jgi:NAD(P)-dependent dehydrogenase (short-subunit alcohol dehydrogenase family)